MGPYCNLFWQKAYLLIACLLSFLCSILGAVTRSSSSLLASKIVVAFAGGSTEALGAAILHVGLYVQVTSIKRPMLMALLIAIGLGLYPGMRFGDGILYYSDIS